MKRINQKGSVLIITLLLLTILISLVVEFAYDVYISSTTLSNWGNAQKASLLAKSGQTIISNYMQDIKKLSYTYHNEIYLPAESLYQQAGLDLGYGYGSLLSIKIEDENSKFNINSIISSNGTANEKALSSLKRLFEHLNINPSLALTVADWIDPDSEPRGPNSEDNAKNSYLWSINELKLINGVDEKIFETISPFITIYGNGMININTAKLPVLMSLSDEMTEALAKKIIYYRESTPFEDAAHIVRVSGMETIGQKIQCSIEWCPMITVKSSSFRITATATVDEITRVIESVIDTSMKVHHWREV